MVSLTFYGSTNEIGGNKILLEDNGINAGAGIADGLLIIRNEK